MDDQAPTPRPDVGSLAKETTATDRINVVDLFTDDVLLVYKWDWQHTIAGRFAGIPYHSLFRRQMTGYQWHLYLMASLCLAHQVVAIFSESLWTLLMLILVPIESVLYVSVMDLRLIVLMLKNPRVYLHWLAILAGLVLSAVLVDQLNKKVELIGTIGGSIVITLRDTFNPDLRKHTKLFSVLVACVHLFNYFTLTFALIPIKDEVLSISLNPKSSYTYSTRQLLADSSFILFLLGFKQALNEYALGDSRMFLISYHIHSVDVSDEKKGTAVMQDLELGKKNKLLDIHHQLSKRQIKRDSEVHDSTNIA